MALCDLGKREVLKNSILFEVSKDPRTNGLQEGQTYPAETARLQGLDEIGFKYGGSHLYLILPGGNEIIFSISIPDAVVESYGQAEQGKTTTWQRQTRNDKPESTLAKIAESLQERIIADTERLNRYADSVLLSARAIEKNITDNPDLAEAMSETWTALKQDPDGVAKVRMIAQFLSEAKNFMEAKLARAEALKFDPETRDGDEAILLEIETQADFYAPIIKEFAVFLSDAPANNPIKKVVKAADDAMSDLKKMAQKVHTNSAIKELLQVLAPSMAKARAEKESDIRKLEANKSGASPSQVIKIDRKIAQIRQDIDEFLDEKNVELSLIGQQADATWVGKYFVAGMGNKDIIVQGFMKIIKDKYQEAERDFQATGAEIGERFKALEMSTGNIDEAFKDLYTEVETSFFNEQTGEVEKITELYFVSEVSEQWRSKFTELKANLSKLTKEILTKRKEGATAADLKDLEEQHDAIKTEYIQFRRENFETEYGDRYQAADAMLDTPILIGGNMVTPREIRANHFDAINSIQTRYMALTGIPSNDDIEEINRLRLEFEKLKSLAGKVPGTGEYQMAEVFTAHAAEMKEMTDRWETTPASLDRFNTRKADIDKRFEAGEIDKEERDRWYTANTTTVYNPKYWAERRATVEALNRLAEDMSRITGHAKENSLKANYEEMEAVAKKYRDSNSHIDGTMLSESEREKILRSEEDIEALKQEMKQAYSGFLGADFQVEYDEMNRQLDIIAEQMRKLRRDDPAMSNSTRAEIAELKRQSKALKSTEKAMAAKFLAQRGVSKEDIKAFQALYDEYMGAVRHLSELTESVETQYYYDTYQSELNKFLAGKTQAQRDAKVAKTNTVLVGKTKYEKGTDGEFYEVLFDGTKSDEPTPADALMDQIFKKEFEGSEWFQKNHFGAEKWIDGGMKKRMIPIYSWRISEPRDKRWIKEHAPNIAWKRRVIKEEFRNPNYGLGPDGLPKLKQGLHANTGYDALRAANPALWEFRDFMINEVFLPAQREQPKGQRTLGMKVPTKERDSSLYDTVQRRGADTGTRIKRKFALNEQDTDEGLYAFSDAAGYEKKFIPVKFQGRLEAQLVSRNIVETIGQYAAQAKLHKARTELLNIGKSLESSLAFQNHTPSSTTIDKIGGFLGVKKWNKKRGVNERLDTIKNMVDMFVYGENIDEKSELGKKIHKVMSNLLGIKATLLFSEAAPIAHTVATGAWSIGGSSWAQVVNLFGGVFQALIKTSIKSGHAKFSMSDYVFGTKEYLRNSGAFVNDIGKVSGRSFWTEMADFFDTREMHYVDEFGEQLYSRGLVRQVNMSNLAFAKNVVEHELMMVPFMAFTRNYQVEGPDGKIALKDAFEMQGGRLVVKDGVSISDAEMSDIRGYIAAMLRGINGNYGKLDRTFTEQLWYGKAIMFMRKWMIPMVVERYAGKKFSVEQDRVVTGHIRESFSLAISALTGGITGAPSPKSWVGWPGHIIKGIAGADSKEIAAIFHPSLSKTMTDAEKDSLRKTRIEVLLLISMWVAYRFGLGWDKDDPDRYEEMRKDSVMLQGLTYSLVKATSEQSTFLPVAGIDEIGKMKSNLLSNTAPIVGEMWTIVSKDINWTNPEQDFFKKYKTSSETFEKGDSRAAQHAWKLLGLTAAKESPVAGMKAYETSLNK
jgi:uncharacterized protein YukE